MISIDGVGFIKSILKRTIHLSVNLLIVWGILIFFKQEWQAIHVVAALIMADIDGIRK